MHRRTGCAIGEVLGMVIATAAGWGDVLSIAISVVLAFFFGYLLTMRSVLGELGFRDATKTALAADTASITVREIVDNAFIVVVPGALDAELGDALFWWSLGVGLFIAFWVALPVNRWMIGRGRGHAVAHAHHH